MVQYWEISKFLETLIDPGTKIRVTYTVIEDHGHRQDSPHKNNLQQK